MDNHGKIYGIPSEGKSKSTALWPALIVIFIISVVIVICATTINITGTNEESEIDPFLNFQMVAKNNTEDFAGKGSTTFRGSDGRAPVVVSRWQWLAQPAKSKTFLIHPVEFVVISETSTDPCTTQAECMLTVRYLQDFHLNVMKWMDIAYNFMVGGDGKVYKGRGWDAVGGHTAAGMNEISLGISFLGTFSDVLPSPLQLRVFKQLIEEGIKLEKISADYKLIAERQVTHSNNPGYTLYEDIKKWEHWSFRKSDEENLK